MATGVSIGISYGHAILPKDDPYAILAQRNAFTFAEALRPGAFIVGPFPICQCVPILVSHQDVTLCISTQ